MSILQSIILGAVQGLTEFLPISSSGHLFLIPYFFKWNYQGVAFDVALHAGTAIALLAYFWKDWLNIIKNAFWPSSPPFQEGARGGYNASSDQYPNNLLWQIAVASVPAVILGLAIDKYIEKNFHSVLLVAFNFAFFGWLLWYADKKAKADLAPQAITYKKAFLVGVFQAIALIPGVSRSGITITASRLIGLKRDAAARFSFLIATPAIVGALLLKLPDIFKEGIALPFWLAVAAAVLFGLAAIKFLLDYLKKSDFSIFLWYRLAVALVAAIVFFVNF